MSSLYSYLDESYYFNFLIFLKSFLRFVHKSYKHDFENKFKYFPISNVSFTCSFEI